MGLGIFFQFIDGIKTVQVFEYIEQTTHLWLFGHYLQFLNHKAQIQSCISSYVPSNPLSARTGADSNPENFNRIRVSLPVRGNFRNRCSSTSTEPRKKSR